MGACTHTHTQADAHRDTHGSMHSHAHSGRCTHRHTHGCLHTCMQTHTRTQVHIQTPPPDTHTPRHTLRWVHALRRTHLEPTQTSARTTRTRTPLTESADLVLGLRRPSSSSSQTEGTVCEAFWEAEHTSSLAQAGAEPTLRGSSLPGALSSRLGVTFSRTRAAELPPKGHSFDSRFCPVHQWPQVLGTGSTCL